MFAFSVTHRRPSVRPLASVAAACAIVLASLALGVWGVARWGQAGSLALVLGGAVYVLGHFGTTAAFNVPLNEALDRVDPASAEAARVWADYVVRWTHWNHVRTVACLASTVLFLTASR